MIPLLAGVALAIAVATRGDQPEGPKPTRLSPEHVIKLWAPLPDGAEDFQQFWASPKESPDVAAATFRVVGPSFERLWSHYADLCGIAERYEATRVLVSAGQTARGAYVVADRASRDELGKRRLSVFLLRTDRYTVTATIQPDAEGKAVCGSIAVALP